MAAGAQIKTMDVFKVGFALQGRELEKAVDEVLAAGSLTADVGKKTGPVRSRHFFIEKLSGTLNGCERGLEFVSQGLDVLVGILPAFE